LKRLLHTWDRNWSTSGPTPWQIYYYYYYYSFGCTIIHSMLRLVSLGYDAVFSERTSPPSGNVNQQNAISKLMYLPSNESPFESWSRLIAFNWVCVTSSVKLPTPHISTVRCFLFRVWEDMIWHDSREFWNFL
jgi:hypothetical protein